MLKKEIRVVGIDDCPFDKFKDREILVIGTIYRGGSFMDGVLSTKVEVDGKDATEKIGKMINQCKFKPQLKAIFLNGIAVGGFNVINVKRLSRATKLPVIAVIRDYPNFKKIFNALTKLKQGQKIKIIKSLPKPVKLDKIYIQHINISLKEAKEMIELTATHSFIPEPLRIAHLIAAGVVKGESKGRA